MKTLTTAKYTDKQALIELAEKHSTPVGTQQQRRLALDVLHNSDLPNQKMESWTKTSLKPLLQHKYTFAKKIKLDKTIVSLYNISGLYSNIIVFINGHFCHELSRISDTKDVLVFDSLAFASQEYKEIFEEFFNKTKAHEKHWFGALNTAFASDGAFIYVKKNGKVENPVHVYFFYDGEDRKIFSQQRNMIIAGEGSKANILFSYHSLSSDYSFSNIVTEIFVGRNAYLDFNTFQGQGNESFQINLTNVMQEADSQFYANTITMCGRIVRNGLNVEFAGQGSYAELNGLYMPDREQHFDNSIFINHAVPNCLSNQFYRGIIDNNASAVFYGKVLIEKGSTKSEAHQTNNNILLTPYAKVHSKPHLIIYNDDVAASHGSTVGQVDQNALFYMQTRGIGKKKAETLLLSAFADEVINKIQMPQFKLYTKILTEKRLSGEKVDHQCAKLGICRY